MNEPTDKTPSEQPPQTVSDQEVERLLQAAESLTQDIVENVDAESSPDRVPQEASGQFSAAEPDPVAAVELVAQDVTTIAETVNDPAFEADAERHRNARTAESEAEPTLDSRGEDSANEAVEGFDAAELDDAESLDAATVLSSESTSAEPPSTQTTVDQAPATSMPDERSRLSRAKLKAYWDTARGAMIHLGRAVLFAVPNLCITLLVLFDIPFRGMQSSTKYTLGVCGLISLVMGIAAFCAPRMLRENPYARLPPAVIAAETTSHK